MTTFFEGDRAVPAIDRALAAARARIGPRVQPGELAQELVDGALVVDTRPEAQRRADGELPGAVVIERNVLEWRLDPTSPHRITGADRSDRRIVIVCDEGYSSSLVAAGLLDLGLTDVTDLAGGFQAWRQLASRGQNTGRAAEQRRHGHT